MSRLPANIAPDGAKAGVTLTTSCAYITLAQNINLNLSKERSQRNQIKIFYKHH